MGYTSKSKQISPRPTLDTPSATPSGAETAAVQKEEKSGLHDSVDKLFENVKSGNYPVHEDERLAFKVVVMGGAGVGKTTFLKSIGLSNSTTETLYTVSLQSDRPTDLYFSDGLMTGNVDAIIYMYDITRASSFSHMMAMRNYLSQMNDDFASVPSILLGNKLDMARTPYSPNREVDQSECALYNSKFLEISSLTGENVKVALNILVKLLTKQA